MAFIPQIVGGKKYAAHGFFLSIGYIFCLQGPRRDKIVSLYFVKKYYFLFWIKNVKPYFNLIRRWFRYRFALLSKSTYIFLLEKQATTLCLTKMSD